jgi:hypothetical protein
MPLFLRKHTAPRAGTPTERGLRRGMGGYGNTTAQRRELGGEPREKSDVLME